MPGHKRNTELLGVSFPFDIDITEINGFDNLHNSQGILKQAAEKCSKVFHTNASYMLINGSTCGILAAIRSAADFDDEIIIARNCHKSVYNACLLNRLKPAFIYPEQDAKTTVSGSVTPADVEAAIEKTPNAKAVVLTSPTYEGVISDIGAIAEITHRHSIPLIVDNAHGAHQRFCSFSKGEPIGCGADIVISSLHKTLPSPTQTAAAHFNSSLVSKKRFERSLAIFQTSSPSYVLMAAIEKCFEFLESCETEFYQYEKRLENFSSKMKKLKNLSVICHGNDTVKNHNFYAFDFGKIVISTINTNISGKTLMELLREKYGLELEMAYPFYAVAMTSVCDTDHGFERLANALLEIDKSLVFTDKLPAVNEPPKPESSGLRIDQAEKLRSEMKIGGICSGYVYAYPPGIPIIIPGEIWSGEVIEYIRGLSEYIDIIFED